MLANKERVVMVSGASRGIGRAVARRLYDDGYRLSLGMRPSPAADEAARGMEAERLLVASYEARAARSAGRSGRRSSRCAPASPSEHQAAHAFVSRTADRTSASFVPRDRSAGSNALRPW